MNHLPNNIKAIRTLLGESQADFAEEIGLTRPKLQSYERGVTPKLEYIVELAAMLGMTLDTLIAEEFVAKRFEHARPQRTLIIQSINNYQIKNTNH
jgi:transcriptional regulator with XRE-family HTH domain